MKLLLGALIALTFSWALVAFATWDTAWLDCVPAMGVSERLLLAWSVICIASFGMFVAAVLSDAL